MAEAIRDFQGLVIFPDKNRSGLRSTDEMSENTNEPDLPDIPESDTELEALLKKLNPAPLGCSELNSLHREYQITALDAEHGPRHIHWRKVIHLAAACCIATLGYIALRYGPSLQREVPTNLAVETGLREVAPIESKMESFTGPSAEDFLPVSAQGYLINSSSKGVIKTDEGLRERMSVEYRDAYHWHDPETGTNVRFFKPRSEEVIVPLQTD